MRKGYHNAGVKVSSRGNLLAIATGSDACAEHEWGINALFTMLTTHSKNVTEQLIQTALTSYGKDWDKFKSEVSIPDIFESKRIVNPQHVKFVKVSDTEAYMWVCDYAEELTDHIKRECNQTITQDRENVGISGAWDGESFGFKAFNKKAVKYLTEMFEHVKNKNVVFAGKLFQEDNLGGIVLAVADRVKSSKKDEIIAAQVEFEAHIELQVKGDLDSLKASLIEASGDPEFSVHSKVGYIWPVRSNNEVKYAINPAYAVKADYYGPYSAAQLINWVSKGMNFQLAN